MPRNVRNFWIELNVDGRASRIEAGPINKSGGFSMNILMRHEGGILRALHLEGVAHEDGTLAIYTDVGRDAVELYEEGLELGLRTNGGHQIIQTKR